MANGIQFEEPSFTTNMTKASSTKKEREGLAEYMVRHDLASSTKNANTFIFILSIIAILASGTVYYFFGRAGGEAVQIRISEKTIKRLPPEAQKNITQNLTRQRP